MMEKNASLRQETVAEEIIKVDDDSPRRNELWSDLSEALSETPLLSIKDFKVAVANIQESYAARLALERKYFVES